MSAQKWALRRSPTVEQEVFGPCRGGTYRGLIEGDWWKWPSNGLVYGHGSHEKDLVPLQSPPVKALRCWFREGAGFLQWRTTAADGYAAMIDRAPGDALAAAVDAHVKGWVLAPMHGLYRALAAYREATE